MPNFAGKGAPGLAYGASGLIDTLAAALRGGTKGALGLPGDLESLFRDKTTFPTSEDWDKRLPQLEPLTGGNWKNIETMGQFVPAPSVLALGKAVKPVTQILRTTSKEPSLDRRKFLSQAGVMTASAALPSTVMLKALREMPIATKIAPTALKGIGALKAAIGAKLAAHNLSDALYDAKIWGHSYTKYTPDELVVKGREYFPEKTDEEILNIYNRMLDMKESSKSAKGTKTLDDPEFRHLEGPEFDNEIMKQIIAGKIEPKDFKPGTFNDFDIGNTDYFDAHSPIWGY